MAIETRSASKRRIVEQDRIERLPCCELVLHRIDCLTVNIASFIYVHLYLIYGILVASLAIAYIDASTDAFERLAALTAHREPVLSDPPKQVSLAQFLGLCELWKLIENNKVAACMVCPAISVLLFWASQPRTPALKKKRSQRSFTASNNRV